MWLFAQQHFRQPFCWWAGLFSHPVCCLSWTVPVLEPTDCWVGPGLHAGDPSKMSASSRVHIAENSSKYPPPVSTSPGRAIGTLPPPQETQQDQEVGLSQVSMGAAALLPLKAKFLGAPPIDARPPGWGDWCGAQNFHSCGWISVIYLFSSLLIAHPGGMGFDYITSVPLLPFCFDCRISFFCQFPVFFLLMVVQQLLLILVFSWEDMSSRSSTLPSSVAESELKILSFSSSFPPTFSHITL